jgi:hypothetical protein
VSIVQLKSSWRPFLVSMIMMLLLQTSGLLVLVYYAVSIFQVKTTFKGGLYTFALEPILRLLNLQCVVVCMLKLFSK